MKRFLQWVSYRKHRPIAQTSEGSSFAGLIDAPPALELTPAPLPPAAADVAGTVRLWSGDRMLAVFADPVSARRVAGTLNGFAMLQRVPAETLFRIEGEEVRLSDAPGETGRAFRELGPVLVDAWYRDTHALCLVLDTSRRGLPFHGIRMFQAVAGPAETDHTLRVFPVGEAGLHATDRLFVTASLRNPLLPVLVTLLDAEGRTTEAGLLAFPSLVRGGIHAGELRAHAPCADLARAFLGYDRLRFTDAVKGQPSLKAVTVHVGQATGAEPILSADMGEWLGQVFGLEVTPKGDEDDGSAPVLELPPDSVPTVAALTADELPEADGNGRIVDFLVCDRIDYSPRQSVCIPKLDVALRACQPSLDRNFPVLRKSPKTAAVGTVLQPTKLLALRFRSFERLHDAAMLFPHAPDRVGPILPALPRPDPDRRVLGYLSATDAEAAKGAIATLGGQNGADRIHLLVACASAEVLRQIEEALGRLPGGWEAVPGDWDPFRADDLRDSEHLQDCPDDAVLVRVSEGTLLHDPRLLESLLSMLHLDGISMAGAVTLSELPARKGAVLSVENGGYFPSHVSLIGAPSLVFSEVDTLEALPDATYPVVAPPEDVFVVGLGALRRAHRAAPHLPGGRQAALMTGLTLTALGETCLCTSAVRAVSVGAPSYREAMDCVSRSEVPLSRWEEILGRVTLVHKVT